MADWQATAVTIHCDAVADDITIIVYPDWSTKCTGLDKYTSSQEAGLNLVRRSLDLRVSLNCLEGDCPRIPEYVEKLRSEEATRKAQPDHSG